MQVSLDGRASGNVLSKQQDDGNSSGPPSKALVPVDSPDTSKKPSVWLERVISLSKHFLPYQAPPRRMQSLFYHILVDLVLVNGERINESRWLLKDRGVINRSVGLSNWPTMTGNAEYSLELTWYKGGRDIKIGDLVTACDPMDMTRSVVKRVVGLPMCSVSRRLFRRFTYDRVTV